MNTSNSIAAFAILAGTSHLAFGGVTNTATNRFTFVDADNGSSSQQDTNHGTNNGGWSDINQFVLSNGSARVEQSGALNSFGLYQANLDARADGDISFLGTASYLAQSHFEVFFTLSSSYNFSMNGNAQAFQTGSQNHFASTIITLSNLDTNTTTSFANVANGSVNFNTSGLLGAGNYRFIADSTAWVNLFPTGDSLTRASGSFNLILTDVPAPSGMLTILAIAGMVGTPRRSRTRS